MTFERGVELQNLTSTFLSSKIHFATSGHGDEGKGKEQVICDWKIISPSPPCVSLSANF